jgi:hypothetical protein
LLETDSLLFRGADTRLELPFRSISEVAVAGGVLRVTHADGVASFGLGDAAERWAEKIRNPRPLLDKLGVKPGSRVAVIDVDDPAFIEQLAGRTEDVTMAKPKKDSDVIFFGAESVRALSALPALRKMLKPNGAIWVVHRKGKQATLKDVEVFTAAKAAGLVDNKVASFSATHTAERLVIPLAKR